MRNVLFTGSAVLLSSLGLMAESRLHENFNGGTTKQVSRYSSQLVAQKGGASHFYTRGKVSFIAGKEGYALNLSEGKGRVEGRLRLGQKFYDANVSTVGFWIKATQDDFGVKDQETVIVEERGSGSFFALVKDKFGRFSLKGATTFVAELPTIEAIVGEKSQNFDADIKEAEVAYRKKFSILNDRPLSEAEKIEVDKGLKDRYQQEAEQELAELKKTGSYEQRGFDFLCDKKMNTSAFKDGKWNHIAISWNSFSGQYYVYFNGEMVVSTENSTALRDGFRKNSGEYLVFSPGKSGLQMAIDNVKIKGREIEEDFKVDDF